MTESVQSPPAFQFSIRALLAVTTVCAVVAWAWPKHGHEPVEFHVMLAIGIVAFVTSIICARPSWQNLLARTDSSIGKSGKQWRAWTAFIAGALGVLPYSTILLVPLLDPLEAGVPAIHNVMVVAWRTSIYSVVPALVLLLASFMVYFGFDRNRPLFIMRGVGLVANLAWPVLFYVMLSKCCG